jgi:hypothetical protein
MPFREFQTTGRGSGEEQANQNESVPDKKPMPTFFHQRDGAPPGGRVSYNSDGAAARVSQEGASGPDGRA